MASCHEELYDEYVRLQKEGEVPLEFMYSPCESAVIKFFVMQLTKTDIFFNDGICVFQLPIE
ncbi:MAG: hypothetical protein IKU52_04575, partial [Clostridia bacterium]|nr:hypothetical protein [Clostridia bacterium]